MLGLKMTSTKGRN